MSIKELLKLEQEHRKFSKWWWFTGLVMNDHDKPVMVNIKSYGLYNQIFKVTDPDDPDDNALNQASGHTIVKVTDMQNYLRNRINLVGLVRATPA